MHTTLTGSNIYELSQKTDTMEILNQLCGSNKPFYKSMTEFAIVKFGQGRTNYLSNNVYANLNWR